MMTRRGVAVVMQAELPTWRVSRPGWLDVAADGGEPHRHRGAIVICGVEGGGESVCYAMASATCSDPVRPSYAIHDRKIETHYSDTVFAALALP